MPTPRPPSARPALARALLRGFILLLTGMETAVFLLLVFFAAAEGDGGFRIMTTIAELAAIPYFLAVFPALVLAWKDRFLPLALALSVGVVAAAVFIWPRL